jgi:hypothetical protein
VTVTTLGQPTDLADALARRLTRYDGAIVVVRVTPRDEDEFKVGARWADHYEIRAFYTLTTSTTLDILEGELRDTPGVYMTTQVRPHPANRIRNIFTNPEWPAKLGERRRDRDELRPQVLALIKDPEATPS